MRSCMNCCGVILDRSVLGIVKGVLGQSRFQLSGSFDDYSRRGDKYYDNRALVAVGYAASSTTMDDNASSDATHNPASNEYNGPCRILCKLSTYHQYYLLGFGQEQYQTEAMEKRYICPRCNQEVSSQGKLEHDDRHFAEDIDRAEGAPSQLPIRPPPMSDRKHSSPSPTKSKSSWLQPVDSHHHSTTTSSHATKKHHHVPHVNAVDKAATSRAQSEVRTIFS
jgi:hypothetical protein